ncbi:MAG: hypothetical protein IJ091_01845 [Oscillospiraceae bacterium]|nr:hypothetical protein [Oscillospiraceae bacterium]
MDKLISAEKLKRHYSWWDCTEKGAEDKRNFDAIVDAQPEVPASEWGMAYTEISKVLKAEATDRRSLGRESEATALEDMADFFGEVLPAKIKEAERGRVRENQQSL